MAKLLRDQRVTDFMDDRIPAVLLFRQVHSPRLEVRKHINSPRRFVLFIWAMPGRSKSPYLPEGGSRRRRRIARMARYRPKAVTAALLASVS